MSTKESTAGKTGFFTTGKIDIGFEVKDGYVYGVCLLYPSRADQEHEYMIREKSIVAIGERDLSACVEDAKDFAYKSAISRLESAGNPAATERPVVQAAPVLGAIQADKEKAESLAPKEEPQREAPVKIVAPVLDQPEYNPTAPDFQNLDDDEPDPDDDLQGEDDDDNGDVSDFEDNDDDDEPEQANGIQRLDLNLGLQPASNLLSHANQPPDISVNSLEQSIDKEADDGVPVENTKSDNDESSNVLEGNETFASTIAETSNDLAFPLGNAINSPAFAGTAYLLPMIANDDVFNFPQTNNVSFEPGARSSWHTHGGMIILVAGGVGYYQEEGQPAQIIRKGDVIECASGVKHWHGAAPDSWFSQMVIYDSHYSDGKGGEPEPVTDDYYESLVAEEYAGRIVTTDNEFMFQRAEQTSTMDTFSGPIYLSSVIGGENVANAPGLHYVVFKPGVINNWHTHAGGQIIIATDGIGYHQMEGEPVEVLYPGDVALCPPDVKHWHGGSANTQFAHIAINTNPELGGVEWFDRIPEEEYNQLTTEKAEG